MKQSEENRIEYLTSAFLDGGLTQSEQSELETLLKFPSNKEYFKEVYTIWQITRNRISSDNAERAYNNILSRIEEEHTFSNKIKLNTFWRNLAAAVIFGFIIGLGGYFLGKYTTSDYLTENKINVIKVPFGSQSTIELPDGSIVTLNSGSVIKYSNVFSGKDRNIKLEGEAYFKVKKNSKKPFVVYAKNTSIQVLGTTFNVKAYPEEDVIETTLVEGSVKVKPEINNSAEKEIILKPNQTLSVQKNSNGKFTVSLHEKINPVLYTSWKDPRWIIQGEKMGNMMKKLQRKYDVNIEIADKSLNDHKFSGTLADETLEQTLDIIKSIAPIEYTLDKKNVRITINPEKRKLFEQFMN